MRLIFLVIGIVLGAIFITNLFKGQKYDYMIDPLDPGDFPLKSLYSAGFSLQQKRIFALKGVAGSKLRNDAALYYSKKYSEYYSQAIWAQVLTLFFFFSSLGFICGGVFKGDFSVFSVAVGMILAIISAYYFYTHTGSIIEERRTKCESEFPNAISKLALIVNSGVILHDAWQMVAFGNEGELYTLMQNASNQMKNGVSDIDAIYEFGYLTNSGDIKKFSSALIQNIERGGGDLPYFLENQSSELWAHHRQVMLQRGEKAAGELLIPIALMFLGIMLIVIVAAVQSFGI